MKKSICFAYFGDGKFLGWYADSFGSIRRNSPKVYSYSESQIEVIRKNFKYKLEKIKKDLPTTGGLIARVNPLAGALINEGTKSDKEILSQYKEIELKVIECPEYNGPNPDFDEEGYKTLLQVEKDLMVKEGIYDMSPGLERIKAIDDFHKKEGDVGKQCNNWIHADYTKVKAWAENEPTEFLETIKP